MVLRNFSESLGNAMLDTMGSHLNGGSIKIYTTGGSSAGTLLATIELGNPALAAAAGKSATANATIRDEAADSTGTAAVAEFCDSANNIEFEGDVTDEAGGGNVRLPSTSITAGEPVEITSGSFTFP